MWIFRHGVISENWLFAWKACPSLSPESFITGGYFKRYQMCQTFTLITPSDGSPGLMVAIWECWGTRLKHRHNGGEKYEEGMNKISLKKFINNAPCTRESCCLFNYACLFPVSVLAETQTQHVLWVNMTAQEEDNLGLHQSSQPRLPTHVERPLPAANLQPRDERSTFCISSLRRKSVMTKGKSSEWPTACQNEREDVRKWEKNKVQD